MKKSFFVIALSFTIIVIIIFINFSNIQKQQRDAQKFNRSYEEYNKENLNGLDITTIINKAIDNNEKHEIQKNDEGLYIEDDMYSIKIYIKMIINEKTYPMEKINALGMESFIKYFDSVDFKCTDIQYHKKNGRVSQMTFEATEY